MIIALVAILALWITAAIVLAVAGSSRPDVAYALASNEQIVSGWDHFDDVRATWAADEKIAA